MAGTSGEPPNPTPGQGKRQATSPPEGEGARGKRTAPAAVATAADAALEQRRAELAEVYRAYDALFRASQAAAAAADDPAPSGGANAPPPAPSAEDQEAAFLRLLSAATHGAPCSHSALCFTSSSPASHSGLHMPPSCAARHKAPCHPAINPFTPSVRALVSAPPRLPAGSAGSRRLAARLLPRFARGYPCHSSAAADALIGLATLSLSGEAHRRRVHAYQTVLHISCLQQRNAASHGRCCLLLWQALLCYARVCPYACCPLVPLPQIVQSSSRRRGSRRRTGWQQWRRRLQRPLQAPPASRQPSSLWTFASSKSRSVHASNDMLSPIPSSSCILHVSVTCPQLSKQQPCLNACSMR